MIFLLLFFYGYQAFIYDLSNRPDYWLDNRPLVYKYFLKLSEIYPEKFRSLIGWPMRFFTVNIFGGRCDANFTLAGFNFKESPPKRYKLRRI